TIDEHSPYINQLYREIDQPRTDFPSAPTLTIHQPNRADSDEINITEDVEEVEESLSLIDKESDLIKKALKKHKGKRKLAAQELGISERTLYRKIKDLNL